MFEYFPGNYVWNLAVNLALNQGVNIGEVDEACRPLLDSGTSDAEDFFHSWVRLAERLERNAEVDAAAGRNLTAAGKYFRSSGAYLLAERAQGPSFDPRKKAYQAGLDTFRKYVDLSQVACEFVEIPYFYAGKAYQLQGLLVSPKEKKPWPCVVLFNGLDSTKEVNYSTGLPAEFAQRGVATLLVDQPGSGAALRLDGLPALVETEKYGSACFDYLDKRDDIDSTRIGVCAPSMGGYVAPRAAAFESRFALCVAWGGIYDWDELHRRRRQRAANAGAHSVPHFYDHICWVYGQKSVEDFFELVKGMTLAECSANIKMPFLIIHGEKDVQVPVEMAYKQYDAAVNSVRRELKVMTPEDGGSAHCGGDNMYPTLAYIADWVADVFGTMPGNY